MARKTGVTSETVKRLIMDAGVVYLNYGSTDSAKPQKILGACRGGNVFNVETEWRDMPFDGVGGLVKGARRAISTTVTLTVNLVEINKELLKLAVPGSNFDNGTPVDGETYYELKRVMQETIPNFDYSDVAIVAEYSGTKAPVICGIKNGIADSNLELNFTDADESVMTITFKGAIDPANITEEPWFIRMPEKSA